MRSVETYRNVGKADYLFLKDEPATPGVTGRSQFNKEANQLNCRSLSKVLTHNAEYFFVIPTQKVNTKKP
ncbi:protein of unknown function [Shewanella benthica]|uniref:Uncharacterized protein n=1 Tax=Shewanella benthica TaxID=43661 RepID=A0A330LZG3_9GAMM|nr:protein of unknown function [Shewanella benthica]